MLIIPTVRSSLSPLSGHRCVTKTPANEKNTKRKMGRLRRGEEALLRRGEKVRERRQTAVKCVIDVYKRGTPLGPGAYIIAALKRAAVKPHAGQLFGLFSQGVGLWFQRLKGGQGGSAHTETQAVIQLLSFLFCDAGIWLCIES